MSTSTLRYALEHHPHVRTNINVGPSKSSYQASLRCVTSATAASPTTERRMAITLRILQFPNTSIGNRLRRLRRYKRVALGVSPAPVRLSPTPAMAISEVPADES